MPSNQIDPQSSDVADGRPMPGRRTLLKGMAWTAPVILGVAAAPFAAASVNNASFAQTNDTTSLARLQLIDTQSALTAKVLTTLPTVFTLTNGAGALNGTAKVIITVGKPGGINITLGAARGFGVYKFRGGVTAPGTRTVTYQSGGLFDVDYGFPTTSFTSGVFPITLGPGASQPIPVEFGLAGKHYGVSISALAHFPVTVTIILTPTGVNSSRTLVANPSSGISVPVGAGIL